MILNLGMKHQGKELCKAYVNHDPGMTLTYFTARSKYVDNAFGWGNCQDVIRREKLEGNGQMEDLFF